MMHLFLFTIGPVQSFIAQARKTRDLYAGSRLLSDLAKAGIEACETAAKAQGADCELKFPHFNPNDTEASLPNRFIVKLTYAKTPTDAQLRTLAGNAEGGVEYAVRKHFREIAQEALDSCRLGIPDGFWPQIDNHLDIHWAFQPMEAGQYREAYLALERLLGSVKSMRPFAQYTYQSGLDFGERGRKCSLDGENNALFYRKRQNAAGNWEAPAMLRHNGLGQNSELPDSIDEAEWSQGEALSGISTVKRFYRRKDHNFEHYPSTSAIALQKSITSFPAEVENLKIVFSRNNLGKLIQQCENLHIDLTKGKWESWNDQFFYEENLTSKNIPNECQLFLAKERHRSLANAGFKFDKYYAVLAFDGDHMGQWLSGGNLQPEADLEQFHEELSGKLSDFGREAKKIVDDKNRGKTVYAGGDDYLGFLNLHYLFEAARELRKTFHDQVNSRLPDKKREEKLTFSAGIVVAHYKEPLGMVIQKARDMEKAAKDHGGRNAFGLAVVKASGEVQQTVYKWDKADDSADGCSNWEALEEVFKGLEKDEFSNKFITSLSQEMYQLAGTELNQLDDQVTDAAAIDNGIRMEIERLVVKARNQQKNVSKEQAQRVAEKIVTLKQAAPDPMTRNFIYSLQIADFLSRKVK